MALGPTVGVAAPQTCSWPAGISYPVNPTAAKRYRDAFATSGAKDDPVDAELLWELLARHRDRLRP